MRGKYPWAPLLISCLDDVSSTVLGNYMALSHEA